MKKKKKLEYYVYYWDVNSDCLEKFNIFSHGRFAEDVEKLLKDKTIKTREEFKKRLERDIRYYFQSKCEWEIIVSSWPPVRQWKADLRRNSFTVYPGVYSEDSEIVFKKEKGSNSEIHGLDSGEYILKNREWNKEVKIDVADQILPNLDVLTDYLLTSSEKK
jgi:hypothetical protein